MTHATVASPHWTNPVLATNSTTNTSTSLYSFGLMGDSDSVQAVTNVLTSSNCNVTNSTLLPYDTTNTSKSSPQPQNVVQYYRSSSFALTLTLYTNNATLEANQPVRDDGAIPNIPDTPLPYDHVDQAFLACVNQTIGESLPILDSSATGLFVGSLWLWVLTAIITSLMLKDQESYDVERWLPS